MHRLADLDVLPGICHGFFGRERCRKRGRVEATRQRRPALGQNSLDQLREPVDERQ